MIMDYSRIRDFILSYSDDDSPKLQQIYERAVRDGVPVMRRETRDFIRSLLSISQPGKVLEIGTAVGYSSLMMAECLEEMHADGIYHIDTCELDSEKIRSAKANIDLFSDKMSSITIHEGDAVSTLKGMTQLYDFIFIDAAKAQYIHYYNEALRLSHPGTIILADNIFSDGDVLESHFLVEKRDRTIHDRMREFLTYVIKDPRTESSILSVADGMLLSVVKEDLPDKRVTDI